MTLSRIGCLICLVAVAGCAGAAPDIVITNGKTFTSNPAQPWAQALAIRGDRIVAVGENSSIEALAGSSTRRLDAGGRTIIPGLNDAHQHVAIAPPHDRLELPFDPTVEQIAQALRVQGACEDVAIACITRRAGQSGEGSTKIGVAVLPVHSIIEFTSVTVEVWSSVQACANRRWLASRLR